MELGFYGHERLTGSVPTMQTGHFTNQGAAALDQAILRSMRAGNSSMHAILKDAKALLARQQARIDELSRLATTDELTGLLNRRGFIQVFERELDRIGREKRSGLKRQQGGVVVMIDLDNFKTINDMYGIEASDAALKLVAKTLKMDIRKMDVAARLLQELSPALRVVLSCLAARHNLSGYLSRPNQANPCEDQRVFQ